MPVRGGEQLRRLGVLSPAVQHIVEHGGDPDGGGFGDIGIPISEFKKIAEAVRTVMEAFLA
jgi:hypothetical protein